MDLAGYAGDFHRHRVDDTIKKRVALSEDELAKMILDDDRMKDIALAIRQIDPDRNGYITQQEADDIFRENYSHQMQGKHMFGLLKEFRSNTNKILVDYNKFKAFCMSKLNQAKRNEKKKNDPKQALIEKVMGKVELSGRDDDLSDV